MKHNVANTTYTAWIAEIVELRRVGMKLKDIGKKYGITHERVRQIVVNYNQTAKKPVDTVAVRNQTREASPKNIRRREKIAELRRTGMAVGLIAKTLKTTAAIVSQDIRIYNRDAKYPIPKFDPPGQKISDATRKKIIAYKQSGASCKLLAEKYGVSAALICKICRNAQN